MVRSKSPRAWGLRYLCIWLGSLLVLEVFVWLWYAVAVGIDHVGLDSNAMPPLTGPFMGPSTVHGYGVASEGRDFSTLVALIMAGIDFHAVFGLVVRSAALRSRAFTATAVGHALLLLWALFLVGIGAWHWAATLWYALIVAFCFAIRRVGPVTSRSRVRFPGGSGRRRFG
ncbi:hypothetical protein OG948_01440 [Embleya sp. NBC_00888]|uniref:hypothetical protein n=1 Tax=Embleya sp. NBC_00888 TaxID=2975960 RepID=UPI0038670CFE|nr:hypothetical protein OG948_01440 [Embleya sp. NBC_00888]